MELTLKSGHYLQPFLPTTPQENTEADAVKFSLIFIPYAGSQEGAAGRCSSPHEHILRWEMLPHFFPPARLLNLVLLGNRNWTWNGIAEKYIQWGPESTLRDKKKKSQFKITHQFSICTRHCQRDFALATEGLKILKYIILAQESQGHFK